MSLEPALMQGTPDAEPTRLEVWTEGSELADAPGAIRLAEDLKETRLAEKPAAVSLPFPFYTMNPEDVPEDVWERARAGLGKT